MYVTGDANSIRIGSGTNIQDHSLVTVGSNAPAVIGNKVTIGECSRH
jgi:carbonic anhydrase/acetyltransferase-like protein (isoleucine patch superfamily)